MRLKYLSSFSMASDTVLYVLNEVVLLRLNLQVFISLFLVPYPLLLNVFKPLEPYLLIVRLEDGLLLLKDDVLGFIKIYKKRT